MDPECMCIVNINIDVCRNIERDNFLLTLKEGTHDLINLVLYTQLIENGELKSRG